MHIAFVNNTNKWGGVKTWSISMAASFVSAGEQASLYGKDPRFIERAGKAGLSAHLYRPGFDYNPLALAWYRRKFLESRVDVVVVNVGKDLRTAGLAARLAGIPVIHRVGAPGDFRETWQTRTEHALIRPAFMCCSQYVLDELERNVPHVKRYPGIAIHPGTPIAPFQPNTARPPRLVTTSRLSEDKRHMDLLEALAILKNKGYPLALDIVGDGPMRKRLEAFVRDHGLTGQVVFHGFTARVGDFLARADVFVLPSLHEPLGISLEEGMAHGLVPIARNSGGVPEIWPEGLNGLLLPQSAAGSDFAARLEDILSWPEDRLLEVKRKVWMEAEKNFSQERQYGRFRTWVASVLEANPGRKKDA